MPRTTPRTAEVASAPANPTPTVSAPPPAPQKRRKTAKRGKVRQPAARPAVMQSRSIEPMEQVIGQDHPRILKNTGPASEALEPARVQPVDRPVDLEKVAMLAFMREPVTVHIHTTSDKEAEPVFEIFNNGQREIFKRGETKTVERRFVNELATKKITTFSQEFKPDVYGVPIQVQVPKTALRYPFSVIRDDHPRGPDWLRFALAQA
jgi:hypothetical protein